MKNLDITKFKAVAEQALARTNDRRWQNAIDKAVAGVTSGWWIVTELHDGVMVTTESGATYHANGSCQCRAFELGQACKHRALARLLDLYNETATTTSGITPGQDRQSAPQDVAVRARIIADIESAWPQRHPDTHIEDALLQRFGKNRLEMLSIDFLCAIRTAIA